MAVAHHDFGDAGAYAVGIGTIDNDGRSAVGGHSGSRHGGVTRRIGTAAVAPREHHGGAFGEVTPGNRLAQIAGRTGDQRDLAGQPTLRNDSHSRVLCRSLRHDRAFQFALSVEAAAAQASKSSSRERNPVAGSAWLTM